MVKIRLRNGKRVFSKFSMRRKMKNLFNQAGKFVKKNDKTLKKILTAAVAAGMVGLAYKGVKDGGILTGRPTKTSIGVTAGIASLGSVSKGMNKKPTEDSVAMAEKVKVAEAFSKEENKRMYEEHMKNRPQIRKEKKEARQYYDKFSKETYIPKEEKKAKQDLDNWYETFTLDSTKYRTPAEKKEVYDRAKAQREREESNRAIEEQMARHKREREAYLKRKETEAEQKAIKDEAKLFSSRQDAREKALQDQYKREAEAFRITRLLKDEELTDQERYKKWDIEDRERWLKKKKEIYNRKI